MARRRNRGGVTAGVVSRGPAPRAPRAPRAGRAGRTGSAGYGAGISVLPGVVPTGPTVGTVNPPAQPPAQQGPAQIVPDAQYLAELAQRQFERQTQINQYNTETSNDKSTTGEAIRRLLGKGADDRGAIKNQANNQGLFYSGQLGKRLGDYQAEVTRQQGDLTTGLSSREAAREAARQAIAQGASIEDAAALAAAADRQVSLDQADAAAGILATAETTDPTGGGTATSAPGRRRRRRRPGTGAVVDTGYGAGVSGLLGSL